MPAASYNKGDKVEYRAVGGAGENVSHTHGVIENVFQTEDGQTRYTIKNDNTGKSTNYQEMNLVKKLE
ncbi:hypothetical protein LXA43DRAFT_1089215 [Ganoderma leucocontextum]|nr:hypothetical protein LXA43DRAFT_1089215 [Ganoderma leucocontextum]